VDFKFHTKRQTGKLITCQLPFLGVFVSNLVPTKCVKGLWKTSSDSRWDGSKDVKGAGWCYQYIALHQLCKAVATEGSHNDWKSQVLCPPLERHGGRMQELGITRPHLNPVLPKSGTREILSNSCLHMDTNPHHTKNTVK